MKAETADTIYREIVRRSSASGLAYLREQIAAHEAKGCGLSPPSGALKVEWEECAKGSIALESDLGGGVGVTIGEYAGPDGFTEYDAVLDVPRQGGRLLASGTTLESTRGAAEKALPAALADLVIIGRAAARALRGEAGTK